MTSSFISHTLDFVSVWGWKHERVEGAGGHGDPLWKLVDVQHFWYVTLTPQSQKKQTNHATRELPATHLCVDTIPMHRQNTDSLKPDELNHFVNIRSSRARERDLRRGGAQISWKPPIITNQYVLSRLRGRRSNTERRREGECRMKTSPSAWQKAPDPAGSH